MILKLFKRQPDRTPQSSVPAGQRIYAIGDIHGRLDLLDALLASIDADDAARPVADTHIIFLGDLIDRGPESAQVVERAKQIEREKPNTRFLLGNHEEVFLKSFQGDLKAIAFLNRIGGRETILSYGVSEQDYREADYPELLNLLKGSVPQEHIAFLQRFEDLIIFGDYAFVHAGIRPSRTLANQRTSDLRWIREDFTKFRGTLEKTVVHGHTISEDVERYSHRIGIDTGAFASGKLTAMGFEGTDNWILQTVPG
ncbi:MAG: metallophosphoesterase [Pseudomonadota bacterium]